MLSNENEILLLFGNDRLSRWMVNFYQKSSFILYLLFWAFSGVGLFYLLSLSSEMSYAQQMARVLFVAIGVPIGYRWMHAIINSFRSFHDEFQIDYKYYLNQIAQSMSSKLNYLLVVLMICWILYSFSSYYLSKHWFFIILYLIWNMVWWYFILRLFLLTLIVIKQWQQIILTQKTIYNKINIFDRVNLFTFRPIINAIGNLTLLYTLVIGLYLIFYSQFEKVGEDISYTVLFITIWGLYLLVPLYLFQAPILATKKLFREKKEEHLKTLASKIERLYQEEKINEALENKKLYDEIATISFPADWKLLSSYLIQSFSILKTLVFNFDYIKGFIIKLF